MPSCGVALVRRVAGVGRGQPVAGGSWPAGPASPPISQSIAPTAPVDRSEATPSKLARTLVLAATLTAMDPAGMNAVAQAQVNDQPTRPLAPSGPRMGLRRCRYQSHSTNGHAN